MVKRRRFFPSSFGFLRLARLSLMFVPLSAGRSAEIPEGVSSEVLATVYEEQTLKTARRNTNVLLYPAYLIYGLPMDLASSPLDLCAYITTEIGSSFGAASNHLIKEKQSAGEEPNIGFGSGVIVSLYGGATVSRGIFAFIDNVLFRHGANDYYSMGIKAGNPNSYIFPHLSNWSFRPYDRDELLAWYDKNPQAQTLVMEKVAGKTRPQVTGSDVASHVKAKDPPRLPVEWLNASRCRAVCIGVSKYSDTSIPTIKHAASDAAAFADFLRGAGVPESQTALLVNEKATLAPMLAELKRLKSQTTDPSEMAIVYFSGHGTPLLDSQGTMIDALLVPHDASISTLDLNGVRLSTLRDLFKGSPGRSLFVLDACFAGKSGRGILSPDQKGMVVQATEPAPVPNSWWMTATTGDHFANDFDKAGKGLFTHYLLRALTGETGVDANSDTLVSLAEAFNWTRSQVETVSKALAGPQTPGLVGSGDLTLTIMRPATDGR